MILSDRRIRELLPTLVRDPDPSLVNSASLDIRVGHSLYAEDGSGFLAKAIDLSQRSEQQPYWLEPGAFVLVSTLEYITLPNGYAADMRLKSSRAREGYDQSLAFWVDPGWSGILTMEIRNNLKHGHLPLYPGLRIGQLIIYQLDQPAEHPYTGKYQGASQAETSKEEV